MFPARPGAQKARAASLGDPGARRSRAVGLHHRRGAARSGVQLARAARPRARAVAMQDHMAPAACSRRAIARRWPRCAVTRTAHPACYIASKNDSDRGDLQRSSSISFSSVAEPPSRFHTMSLSADPILRHPSRSPQHSAQPRAHRHDDRQRGRLDPVLALHGARALRARMAYYTAGSRNSATRATSSTAPEISPMFARCFALQAVQVLDTVGGDILELGPGSGVFAADLYAELKSLGKAPGRYRLLEVSPDLRERQKRLIAERFPADLDRFEWIDALPDTIRGMVIGNEVLDVVPFDIVHRHRRRARARRDRERRVRWDDVRSRGRAQAPREAVSLRATTRTRPRSRSPPRRWCAPSRPPSRRGSRSSSTTASASASSTTRSAPGERCAATIATASTATRSSCPGCRTSPRTSTSPRSRARPSRAAPRSTGTPRRPTSSSRAARGAGVLGDPRRRCRAQGHERVHRSSALGDGRALQGAGFGRVRHADPGFQSARTGALCSGSHAASTSSSIFFASPNSMRLLSL